MSSYQHVIVGSDGSTTASNAVRAAARVAAATGGTLHLVTAWSREKQDALSAMGGATGGGEQASWALEATTDAAAIARGLGVAETKQHTPAGHPADVLLDLGDELDNPLIVVGTVGLDSSTERLLGNIPHALTHNSPHDLLLVTRDHAEHGWISAWLATDGSKTACRACAHGLALAESLGATPTVVTVGSGPSAETALATTTSHLGRDDLATRALGDGKPGDVLANTGHAADLLVLGNKGMSGPRRILGSVPNTVTHAVPTDVLLVNTTR